MFRSSRVEVDIHYNPPGIRGEPRYLEGVVRLTKLHGSIDWRLENRILRRIGIPFGAPDNHSDVPSAPLETVMIYPNPAKDVETTEYPYAELFRDFAAAACRPNSVLVTYGYSFGDDHIKQYVMLLPSISFIISLDVVITEAVSVGHQNRIRTARSCREILEEFRVRVFRLSPHPLQDLGKSSLFRVGRLGHPNDCRVRQRGFRLPGESDSQAASRFNTMKLSEANDPLQVARFSPVCRGDYNECPPKLLTIGTRD